MIGVLFILNSRGDIVLSRAFRDNFNIRGLAETFRTEFIATKHSERCPIHVLDKVCFMHLRYETLFVVACTNTNCNCLLAFQYIIRLLQVLKTYFGTVDEATLREHFVTVQELIDESMDFGYPQMTEVEVLQSFITTTGSRADVLQRPAASEEITIKATGKIPWRKDGITYMKNEVFMDVIEEISLLIAQTGAVLQREVVGRIVFKGFLSGMPLCKLCLNDKLMVDKVKDESGKKQIELDDVTFHSCVELSKFEGDRSICFIPPDGDFVLMRYRSSGNVAPPIHIVLSRVKEVAKTRLEIDFRLKTEFPPKLHATDIVVKIPCPKNTANVNIHVASGKAKFDASTAAIIWKIKRVQGTVEIGFSCEISMISTTLLTNEKVWNRPPVSLSFNLPMFAASGLEVVYLRAMEPKLNYETMKWVRYITTAGQYQCRI